MSAPPPDPLACAGCGTTYPDPAQARDCEQTHDGPLTAARACALIAKRIY
jgi:hypothetical protein